MFRKLTCLIVLLLLASFAIAGASTAPAPANLLDLYDNTALAPKLKADWGFSCLIEAGGRTILFDTGRRGAILLDNMAALGVKPGEIEIVVISHIHPDHLGGLEAFLGKNEDVVLFVPQSFLADRAFKKILAKRHPSVTAVSGPRPICDGVWTTGELGRDIPEQALCLETPAGVLVVTGCAHPGVVEIAGQAREIMKADPFCVLGGFHLADHKEAKLAEVVRSLRGMGVRYTGPTHCTGKRALDVFRREYGEACLEMGVGRRLAFGATGITKGEGD